MTDVISSFDFAFLVMAQKADALLKIDKDAILWGPEAVLLRSVLLRAWKEVGGDVFVSKVQGALDTEPVDPQILEAIYRKYDNLGQKMWKEVEESVREVMIMTVKRSFNHFEKQRKGVLKIDPSVAKYFMTVKYNKFMEDYGTDPVQSWCMAHPNQVGNMHEEIRRMSSLAAANANFRTIDRAVIFDQLERVAEVMTTNVSDVYVGRVWHQTALTLAKQHQVTEYAVSAEWDRKTCPVCQRLDGRTFSVESVSQKVDGWFEGEEIPFTRLADVDNKGAEEIRSQDLMPPFHPRSYSSDTEVYTDDGWTFFKDLTGNELFLSPNPEDNLNIEWVEAFQTTTYDPKGKMCHLHSQNFDLLVTLDHDQIFSPYPWSKTKKWKVEEVQTLKKRKIFYIPRCASWKGQEFFSKLYEKKQEKLFVQFMAFWLSDGSVVRKGLNSFYITISNRKSQDSIISVAEQLLPDTNIYKRRTKVEFYNSELGEYLLQFGHSHQKFIPEEIKNASSELIEDFLNAYLVCDGHKQKNVKSQFSAKDGSSESKVFYTTSERMAGDIGECILKVGGYPRFISQEQAGKKKKMYDREITSRYDLIRIYWNKSKTATFGEQGKGEITIVPYQGMAHCVMLKKNHILWVRRNGKTCLSGNCRCQTIMLWSDVTVESGEATPAPPVVPVAPTAPVTNEAALAEMSEILTEMGVVDSELLVALTEAGTPEEARATLEALKKIQESNKYMAKGVQTTFTKLSEDQMRPFAQRVLNEEAYARSQAARIELLEADEKALKLHKGVGELKRSEICQSGMIHDEFEDKMHGIYDWVDDTYYGNVKNGQVLKVLEQIMEESPLLLKAGIFPSIAGEHISVSYLTSLYEDAMALKAFYADKTRILNVVKKVSLAANRWSANGSLTPNIINKLDLKNHVAVNRATKLTYFKDQFTEATLRSGKLVGNQMDFGYSSFAPINFDWGEPLNFMIKVPRKQAAKHLEKNMIFDKVRNDARPDLGDILPHPGEQEVIMKNRYKVVETMQENKKWWVILEPVE